MGYCSKRLVAFAVSGLLHREMQKYEDMFL